MDLETSSIPLGTGTACHKLGHFSLLPKYLTKGKGRDNSYRPWRKEIEDAHACLAVAVLGSNSASPATTATSLPLSQVSLCSSRYSLPVQADGEGGAKKDDS
jgi:hypothetical protein